MILIGSGSVQPSRLFIISSSTGEMLKQASISPATFFNGRAFFNSLGKIFFVSSMPTLILPMFTLLDLTNAVTTSFNFAAVTGTSGIF
jgi:hypothetical protein